MKLRPDTSYPKSDPRHHTANSLATPGDMIRHPREDMREFDAPKAQALSETRVEVLADCALRSGITGTARMRRCASRRALVSSRGHRKNIPSHPHC